MKTVQLYSVRWKRFIIALAAVFAMNVCVSANALEIDLRTACITIADPNNGSQKAAAEELEKHLALIAGSRTPAVGGYEFAIGRIAPGHEAAKEWESRACAKQNTLYFWGDDTSSPKQRNGTLLAVYGFLDEVLGVKWVRPGDRGIVFANRIMVNVPDGWSHRFSPPLLKSVIRPVSDPKRAQRQRRYHYKLYNDEIMPKELDCRDDEWVADHIDSITWMNRMRHVTREKFSFGHAFVKWNDRFYRSHPEYLPLLVNGRRGRDPKSRRNAGKYLHICYSNPGTVDQIISDWLKGGTNKYINVCGADSRTSHCRCKGCRALDADAPGEDFLFDKTDRQVWLWNRIAERAVAIRPDVKLCVYIYANYRKPPRRYRIEYPDNLIAGIVPSVYDDSIALIRDWQAKGLKMFLSRPNYLCYKGAIPRGLERYLFEEFKETFKLGMVGVDEDNYSRSYTMVMMFEFYALARVIANPAISFEQVEREYLSQFGAAAEDMREYYGRVRVRGEAARLVKSREMIEALDDSQLARQFLFVHTDADLLGDLAVVDRALARTGLSDAERLRIIEVKRVVEHSRLVLDFFDKSSVAGGDAEFLAAADRLMDFRIARAKAKDMCEAWNIMISDKRSEAPLWYRAKELRKNKERNSTK